MKQKSANPPIVVRFANRKGKDDLLRQASKLRGSAVYINEHLTRKNADIERQERSLWKQKKIQKWLCSYSYKWDTRGIKGDHGKGNKRFGTVQVTLIPNCMTFNTVDQTTFQDKKITIFFVKMGDELYEDLFLLFLMDMRTIIWTCRVFSLVYVCFCYIRQFFLNGSM